MSFKIRIKKGGVTKTKTALEPADIVKDLKGVGRPDNPSTTNGAIKGNEPNGTVYISTDGANVGAWKWQKLENKWKVIDGDTGWRKVKMNNEISPDGYVYLRRINNVVYVEAGGGEWGAFTIKGTAFYGGLDNQKTKLVIDIPEGFKAKDKSGVISMVTRDGGKIECGMAWIENDTIQFRRYLDKDDKADLRFLRATAMIKTIETDWATTLPEKK